MIVLGSLIRDLIMIGFGVITSSTVWLVIIVTMMEKTTPIQETEEREE